MDALVVGLHSRCTTYSRIALLFNAVWLDWTFHAQYVIGLDLIQSGRIHILCIFSKSD